MPGERGVDQAGERGTRDGGGERGAVVNAVVDVAGRVVEAPAHLHRYRNPQGDGLFEVQRNTVARIDAGLWAAADLGGVEALSEVGQVHHRSGAVEDRVVRDDRADV